MSTASDLNAAWYQLVAERSTDLIALTDESGRISFASPSFQSTLGYDLLSLIGLEVLALVHPDDVAATAASFIHVRQCGRGQAVFRLRHVAGNWRWIEADCTHVVDNGQSSILIVGRDITERKRLEAELLQVQKLDTIGRLTSGVIHDFNNLLTGIAGFAELGLSGLPLDHPVRGDLDEIAKAASRAATFTSRSLAFARKQVAAPRLLDLNALILDTDKLLRRLIGAHIMLITLPAPDLGWVWADAGQLEQVIINLALNARDAMADGGLLTISTANVTLGAPTAQIESRYPVDYSVRLTMSDTGTGIEPATRQHLFEPFFTTKAPGCGTGLGLSTCADIIKQHGGEIVISSEPGCGTTVTIFLPRVAVVGSEESTGPPTITSSLPRGVETVLLVEDEETVRMLASRTLRLLGYTVLEASNGAAALQIVVRQCTPIHALLADMTMPQIGGHAVANLLSRQFPNLAIVFMSGHPHENLIAEGRLACDALFLQKPFSCAMLARIMRTAIEVQQ
jgi:two-component system, cell cycle sensor histidine kinase and response regulator CckA